MLENDFRQEILKFSREKYKYKKIRSLAGFACETLMAYHGSEKSAVFLYNSETFEFELTSSNPRDYPFGDIFEKLSDEGVIGEVLSSTDMVTNTQNEWNSNFIILPLINQAGVLGICIIETTIHPMDYTPEEIICLKLFISLMASSLTELINDITISEKTDLLEQLVATRTMHLKIKSKDLTQRLESLTSNLMQSIPHEVRTPINQILGFSKYLQSIFSQMANDEEGVLEIINDIYFSAERLKRLFENYLFHTNLVLISMNLAEIEDLQKKTCYSAQSVIFETAMNMAHNENRQDDIEIDLIDSPIAMYEVFLVKVIEEIISNSLKFTQAGEKINIKSYIELNKYVLIIKDFGSGMEFDQIQTIGAYIQFNRDKNEQQGLGLGLSIINRIINIYQASWDIKSNLGEFTEIMLVLPLSEEKINT